METIFQAFFVVITVCFALGIIAVTVAFVKEVIDSMKEGK